ncbi:uncharacterized protein [Lepeophtheirus salmonis]|uniref:uncharacterized protein n=1 Tax=Lepeophtheirus salmonis TaxID=72036 RepID=UPI001AE81C3E|nr:uncharacterized protein LOC121117736 [Lepeophtheirus salmonis]
MTRPFQVVALDIFSVSGKNFLAYVDRLSGYPALHYFEHSGCTSRVIRKVMERFFIDYGIPEVLESDGGTNFSSREFQEFLSFWGVEWRCSSPHNPQSNGLAEACVKKNEKKYSEIEDGLSTTKIVFGRSTRSIIPMLPEFHQKRGHELCKVSNPILKKGDGKKLSVLKIGESVRIQDHITKRWTHLGTIETQESQRRYLIRMKNGRLWHRNRRFIRLDSTEGNKRISFNIP